MLRILVSDDHPIVRQGIKQILEDLTDEHAIDEVSNSNELIQKIRTTNYDILILDITMPGRSGLDILHDIKQFNDKLPVLIVSMHPEEQYAIRALKSGASGYLTKDSAPRELTRAVQKVLGGGKYITASLANEMADKLLGNVGGTLHERLSDREFSVLCKIAEGKNAKQISEELVISEKTVSTYRSRVLEKMNMKSNTELIRYALKEGLIE